MTYRHRPLPDNGSYIRVVSIQPGTREGDILIDLNVTPFSQQTSPHYEALSYVWGSALHPETAEVRSSGTSGASHAGTLSITRNLAVALRHLRYDDRPRVIWIDALCIDQTNDTEKGRQVALMGEIYRRAGRVVAWLGPEAHDSGRVMALMDYLGSQVVSGYGGNYGLRPAQGATDPSLSDRAVELPFDQAELQAVYHLVCRDWFDRLWVRQEIFLGSAASTVACGSCEVPWGRFRAALAALFAKRHRLFTHSRELEARIDRIRGFFFQPSTVSLVVLRHFFGYALCSDPRDRIYAVLSLLEPSRRAGEPALGIRPDYTRTAMEVYEDAVVRHMMATLRLDFLFQCELPSDGMPAGPSWVPDWSRASRNVWDFGHMAASAKLMDWFRYNPREKTLTLAGVVADVVDVVHPIPFELSMAHEQVLEVIRAMLPRLSELESAYVGGGTLIEAYTRTLMCGMQADSWQPPQPNFPTLAQAAAIVSRLAAAVVKKEGIGSGEAASDDDAVRQFARVARNYLAEKHLFRGRDGHVGIAPPPARPGDSVCVIAGCNAPLVLRPATAVPGSAWLLVGPCYMPGAMQGEHLLGPLPEAVEAVDVPNHDPDKPNYTSSRGFWNTWTGDVFFLDERLSALRGIDPNYLKQYKSDLADTPWEDFIVNPERLRRPGVEIQYFSLV